MELKVHNIKGKETDKKVKLNKSILGIEPNAFGAIGAIVNFAIAFIVSKKNPRPPEKIKKMIEQIRLP